eukprot:7391526-Prymnesium_polylepis.2
MSTLPVAGASWSSDSFTVSRSDMVDACVPDILVYFVKPVLEKVGAKTGGERGRECCRHRQNLGKLPGTFFNQEQL